jgi:CheY-like chemotaxis protein
MIAQPKTRPSALRLLVVEDDALLRFIVAELLREEGFTVVEAANADEAWSYLAGGEGADLVFSDIDMPGSMDGNAFARRLRVDYPDLPVILTSGLSPPDGGMRFLRKPFVPSQLVSLIEAMIAPFEDDT